MRATWVLVCLLALTPQVFYLGSRSPFLLTKALYLCLLGAVACLLLVVEWRSRPPTTLQPALLALAPFVAYAALRGPWGPGPRPEIAAPFLWGTLLLAAWAAAAALAAAQGRAFLYARFLVLLGGLTAAYAMLQTLGLDLPFYRPAGRVFAATFNVGTGGPPFATLGNPNFLGEYLAALLPLAAAMALVGAGGNRWVMAGMATLMATALPLTLARGAWIGAAAGVAVVLWLRPESGAGGRMLVRWGLALVLPGILLTAALATWGARINPWNKLMGSLSQVAASGQGRRLWWDATVRMVADRPLTGVGEGRFREAYPPYQARALSSLARPEEIVVTASFVESPHNDYLHVAAELGIPGLLLLIGGLAAVLRGAARAARAAGGLDRAIRAGGLGGLTALLAAALFGYPLHTASGLFMAGVLSALALRAGPTGDLSLPAPRWQWILLAGATALGFWQSAHLLRVYVASIHLHRGTEALLRGDVPGAIRALARAHEVNPPDAEVQVSLGRAYVAAGRPDLALPYLAAGLHGLDSAPLRAALGSAYAAVGNTAQAEETFRAGVAGFPGFAPLHARYGAFLADQGQDREAAQQLERALALDPRLAGAYYWLGRVRARQGDTARAAAELRRFLELASPGDPNRPAAAALLQVVEAPRATLTKDANLVSR